MLKEFLCRERLLGRDESAQHVGIIPVDSKWMTSVCSYAKVQRRLAMAALK
jgi:hypothetical protein